MTPEHTPALVEEAITLASQEDEPLQPRAGRDVNQLD